ncbi:hypothetical protein DO71_6093 [Burkholderia pseudomallei]|nr:hypothetical protein DO71_6093 [Burkholderia pseudomallei]
MRLTTMPFHFPSFHTRHTRSDFSISRSTITHH